MQLIWKSLTKIKNGKYANPNIKRGVYIWGFRIDGNFIPYYVGIANDIEKRIFDHLSNLISGKYIIYHKDYLKFFSRYQKVDVGKEKLFEPNWPLNFPNFLAERKDLEQHINYMVDNFEFSFAEVPERLNLNVKLKEVEKYVISVIGIENLANTSRG